jgi:hypothetical protein
VFVGWCVVAKWWVWRSYVLGVMYQSGGCGFARWLARMPTAKQVPCSIYAGKPGELFAELLYTVLYTDEYNEAAFVHFL